MEKTTNPFTDDSGEIVTDIPEPPIKRGAAVPKSL